VVENSEEEVVATEAAVDVVLVDELELADVDDVAEVEDGAAVLAAGAGGAEVAQVCTDVFLLTLLKLAFVNAF
jgi:nicotinate-nucleotide pyrophosphorylase